MVRNSGEQKKEVEVAKDKVASKFNGKSVMYTLIQQFNETKEIIRATVWRASPFLTQTINSVHE